MRCGVMKLVSHITSSGPALYIAPLLNTVLLLLVFFFLGSSFVVQSGIPVTLPSSASHLVGFDRADVVTLAAGPEQKIFFNGLEMQLSLLKAQLEATTTGTRRIIIYADRLTPHGRVMDVSSTVLAAGYEVAFATTPDTAP